MNDELIEKLNASADKIGKWVEEAEAFAREQAPLVVQEMLAWGWWSSFLAAAAALIAVVTLPFIVRALWRRSDFAKGNDDMTGPNVALVAACIAGVFIFVFSAVEGTRQAAKCLKISVAPRVYLLEELGVMKK